MVVVRRYLLAALLMLPIVCAAAQSQTADGLPLSAQLFTARSAGDLDAQLAVVEQAGYRHVELFRFYGMPETPADQLKALLDKHHLQVSGFHIMLGDITDNFKHIVEYNKAIGNTRVIIPAFSEQQMPTTKEGWIALGRTVGILSNAFKAEGMQIGFHNHTKELQVFDGKTGFEWFFEGAGPDVIATVDCAWAFQGGQDPAELIRRLKGHVWNIHVKDDAPLGTSADTRGLATVGKGVLKWEPILKAAHESGVQWYTVENDVPRPDALTALRESRTYIEPRLKKELGK
jgi:sugar phosphate isomerase/epimerase